MATQPQAPDLTAIKERRQKAWSSGDYGRVGAMLVIMAEMLCEAVDLRPGQRVLDVACGNAALAAARRFGEVVGVGHVSSLLEERRERARAEGWQADFQEGDAEDLTFQDDSLDLVLSTLGAMFRLNELFGERVSPLRAERRSFVWRLPSAEYFVRYMRDYYGPLSKAFEALDEEGQQGLQRDPVDLVRSYKRSGDETAVWQADYLEVVATRS